MIKLKRITEKHKNPHLNDIEDFIRKNSSKFEYVSRGGEAKVFYFKLNKSLVLNTEVLKPGEYGLKIFKYDPGKDYNGISNKKMDKLKLLSKYGLIPKIFIITKRYVISKFIHGTTISEFQAEYPELMDNVNDKIEKLINIWKKLGFDHGDLSEDNILISENGSIHLIDPYIKN